MMEDFRGRPRQAFRGRSRSFSPPRRRFRSRSPPFRGRRRSRSPLQQWYNDVGGPPPRVGRVDDDPLGRVPLDGPLLTFKHFMDFMDRRLGRDEADTLYKAYRKRWQDLQNRTFFDAHKQEEWFQELFSPQLVIERRNASVELTLSLRTAFEISYNTNPEEILRGNEKAEDLTTNECVAFIPSIPLSVPRFKLLETLQQADGFVKLFIESPSRRSRFMRQGWAFFSTPEQRISATEALNGSLVSDEFAIKLENNTADQRRALIAPPVATLEDHMLADSARAITLIRLLDEQRKLSGTNFLLDNGVLDKMDSVESRLNAVLAYLRQVHLCCFYCGTVFVDEEDMHDRCYPTHVRAVLQPQSASQLSAQWKGWLDDHDSRVQKVERGSWGVRQWEGDAADDVFSSFFQKNVLEERADKVRCGLCSKLFRGVHFVEKHIKNKHAEELEGARLDGENEMFLNNFVDDSRRADMMAAARRDMSPTRPIRGGAGPRGRRPPGGPWGGTRRPQTTGPYANQRGPPMTFNEQSIPPHAKRRRLVSYADLDAPAAADVPTTLNYGIDDDESMIDNDEKVADPITKVLRDED